MMNIPESTKETVKSVFTTACGAVLLLASVHASAETFTTAWAWSDKEASPLNVEHAVTDNYSYSTSHERLIDWPFRSYRATDVFMKRTDVGKYQMRFQNAGISGGTVQVSAYGGNHYCKVVNWGKVLLDQRVNVACYNPSGEYSNGKFTILFFNNPPKGDYYTDAYLWADKPAEPRYTPSRTYQYNSSGLLNSIQRVATGTYRITLPNMHNVEDCCGREEKNGGTVMVTAYGSGPAKCKVQNWWPVGSDVNINVRCHGVSGRLVDTRFVVNFNKNMGTTGIAVAEHTRQGAHAFVLGDMLTPPLYQYNYGSGTVISTKVSTGNYVVQIPGLNPTGSTAQVTAYGSDSRYCSIKYWTGSADSFGTDVHVSCMTQDGNHSDSRFVIQYLTPDIILY